MPKKKKFICKFCWETPKKKKFICKFCWEGDAQDMVMLLRKKGLRAPCRLFSEESVGLSEAFVG